MIGWASPGRRFPGRRWGQSIEVESARDGAVRFELRPATLLSQRLHLLDREFGIHVAAEVPRLARDGRRFNGVTKIRVTVQEQMVPSIPEWLHMLHGLSHY